MIKKFKLCILIFLVSLFSFSFVKAVDINMNLTNSNNINNNISNTVSSERTTSARQNADDYSVTLSAMPEQELGFSNILNIILIVIGVLLILLAIAILIRLKQ